MKNKQCRICGKNTNNFAVVDGKLQRVCNKCCLKTKEPAPSETKAIPAYRDPAEGGVIGGEKW